MKQGRGMLFGLVILLCLSLVLAGCSKKAATDGAAPETKTADESAAPSGSSDAADTGFKFGETPLSFSFYGNYDWYVMQPWGQDPATKWIQENKKVTVEAISSGGAALQKFNTIVASNDLPDVIWGDRGKDVEKLQQAGKLVPLDDYLDKYPNLKKNAGEATLNMLRSSDGKLYQFPNWYTNRPMGNGGYMINKKIHKELGSPKLETFDDLYAYLKQVKAAYPDVIPYEVGIAGQGMDLFYAGFAEDRPVQFPAVGRFVPEGNELKSIFADPVYQEAMLFASKLSREKLMTREGMTQTMDQVKEKINSGKVAVFGSFNTTALGAAGTSSLKAKDPEAGYQMIWPLHKEGVDPNKVWVNQYDRLGWNVSVITTAAENPEGIFAYLDWLTSDEGERNIFWGPEGMYWQGTDENGAPIYTERYKTNVEERTKNMGIWDTFQWAGNTAFIDGSKTGIEMKLPEEQRDWAANAQATIAWKTSYDVTEFGNLDPLPDSEEGIIAQRVADIHDQLRGKILFAKSDEEVISLLERAEADAQKAGYDKLLQFKTKRWQENLKKIKG